MSAARTPLVLLPGLLCDERLWRDPAAALSDIAAPLVADLTCDTSVDAMAARVLAHALPRFALAAHSMGAYVAFALLRLAPERVARLALVAASATPDSPARAQQRRAAIASLAQGRFLGVGERLLAQMLHPDRMAGPLSDEVRAMTLRVGPEAFARQQQAILARPDARPGLAALHMPTLVVVGDADMITPPAESAQIARAVAGAHLATLRDCGHLPPMERPAELSALLRDWLCDG